MKFYRCPVCGNIIELIDGNPSLIKCCNHEMELLEANTCDASLEKHVPFVEIKDGKVKVSVGEIMHPMEEKHYIMWIALVNNNKITRVNLRPSNEPVVTFDYEEGSTIYEYCTVHGLWKKEI